MGEILLVFAYCILILNHIFGHGPTELGMIENVVLFFIMGLVWIAIWIFIYMLYKKMKSNKLEEFHPPSNLQGVEKSFRIKTRF